ALAILLSWVSATVTLAWSLRPMMLGATIATSKPRMTITTIISISVKPLLRAWFGFCFILIVPLIIDLGLGLVSLQGRHQPTRLLIFRMGSMIANTMISTTTPITS